MSILNGRDRVHTCLYIVFVWENATVQAVNFEINV